MNAREAEIRSLLLQQRALNAVRRARGRLPQALGDYLRLLVSSVVGLGILTAIVAWLSPAEPLLILSALGLLFSGQAASYSVRLARDPDFTVPGCGCGVDVADDTATVLRSREGKLVGVPSPFLGVVLYTGLLGAVALDSSAAVVALAVVAGLTSAYLGYVMVVRIASVCSLCVSVAAINLLLLLHLAL